MIVLDATTKKIVMFLGGAITTNQLEWMAHYADSTTTTLVEANSHGASNNTTAVDVVTAPVASTQRIIKSITIHNKDTVSATVNVEMDVSGTRRRLCKITLATLDTLEIANELRVLDSNGAVKATVLRDAVANSVLGRSANSSGQPADIQATTAGDFLTLIAGVLGFNNFAALTTSSNVVDVDDVIPFSDTSASAANRKINLEYLLGMGIAGTNNGRLTLFSGSPVPTSDVTSATAIYWTPYNGNRIALYDSDFVRWRMHIIPEFGTNFSVTNGKNYDVFVFNKTLTPSSTNTSTDVLTFASAHGIQTGSTVRVATTGGGLTAGTNYFFNAASTTTGTLHTTLSNALAGSSKVDLTLSITSSMIFVGLELSAAWTTDTSRADALTTQDGIYVKNADLSRRYLGTFRATGANTTEDSLTKRYLWNLYNQVPRKLRKQEPGDSWTYANSAYRLVNNNTNDPVVRAIVGKTGFTFASIVHRLGISINSAAANAGNCGIGVGTGSGSTTNVADGFDEYQNASGAATMSCVQAKLDHTPTEGLVEYCGLESTRAGSVQFVGDGSTPNNNQAAITGWILG